MFKSKKMVTEASAPFPPHGMLVASATLQGNALHPKITGTVRFYKAQGGTVVEVDVDGLPPYTPAIGNTPPVGPFGFHIHEHKTCGLVGGGDPFAAAGSHYNPTGQPHGNHAGDLPVLFSNHGRAQLSVYTDKFKPEDVIGRTVMIHQHPDDFRTQPAGDSGTRMACGAIVAVS